jgi:hypothetical protein
VLNVHLAQLQALMEDHAFVAIQIRFGIAILMYVRTDVRLINNLLTINACVSHFSGGLIKNAINVHQILSPLLIEVHVFATVQLPIITRLTRHVLSAIPLIMRC